MRPPRILRLPDGRRLCFDDLGAPDAPAVVYLHGTPDSRLARHPDDGLVQRVGARLVAVDRPGAGGSDPPSPGGATLADDLAALLDSLDVAEVALLGWSSGGLAALVAAAQLGDRVRRVATVGTLPPIEAYRDRSVLRAIGPGRRAFIELAIELLDAGTAPTEVAAEVAPHLLPDPLDEPTARTLVSEGAGATGRADLARVPGSLDQLARSLLEAGRGSTHGLAALVAEQLVPSTDLGAIRCPVRLWHGDHDEVSPPAVGEWVAGRIECGSTEVVAGSHQLLLVHWEEILARVVAPGDGHC
jgi:pimeloyl-ACP methyl ester carboxylesterase